MSGIRTHNFSGNEHIGQSDIKHIMTSPKSNYHIITATTPHSVNCKTIINKKTDENMSHKVHVCFDNSA